MDIMIGTLRVKESKNGLQYFVGYVGKIPVKGFYSKKANNLINLSLDFNKIEWINNKK